MLSKHDYLGITLEETMNYIHVAGKAEIKPNRLDISTPIARQTGNCLYSLIDGLKQEDFGLDTLLGVSRSIREYKEKYLRPAGANIFADSGGYSIIKGDVHPNNIRRFIKCYNIYLEDEQNYFDFLFSLDIPFNLKYKNMNNEQCIYQFNKESLLDLKEALLKYPDVNNKVYFVWHFKMHTQYKIWNNLYKELDLNNIIRNRAIGGMVGMREATKISFSPFTPMAYRCLLDYINARYFNNDFRLHFLGMYIPYDRFQIALLEELFKNYLKNVSDVMMSYDSINYSHTARMNNIKNIYTFEDNRLMAYPGMLAAPERLLKDIYGDNNDLQVVLEEVERLGRYEKLNDAGIFAPVNIYSNLNLDRFYKQIITDYGFVGIIESSSSQTVLAGKVKIVLEELKDKYRNIFSKAMCQSIRENLEITFIYHNWYKNLRDYESLNDHIEEFIDLVGFPEKLK